MLVVIGAATDCNIEPSLRQRAASQNAKPGKLTMIDHLQSRVIANYSDIQ